ncbi:FAD/NAD(P)-binding domain-protein [Phialemonium atrogriseum]|uniref:FAD/NAD(P)-binding domain-protein n=1 Tax=Phialemonium atrogriseum TaxID=1093897 RepID=A0AAJ0FRV1_9PEZI|nr:FAD/NAD(P)-binding domain-protein [Phialemonium atrogriseum]KAK1772799.1 FAD/NAD(P)-binding domain-protein [Phialemonium atrogriseum]
MSKLKVLIVGASIAGPTAAYWLAKAGASVTIIERFPNMRTNGQNIDIRTAGVTVMRKMPGMEAAVRAKTIDIEGISVVRDDGRPYGTIRATGNPDQQSFVSEFEIFRGDLAQILFDLTKDNENINYVFGEQVTSIQQNEQDDGPVTVEFANGFPTSEYDLVVACDGATSRTRAIGLGCGVRDHIRPTNCWAAFFSIEQDLLKGSKMGHAYSAPGGRFVVVGSDPSGGSRVTLMSIHPRDDRDATLPFREAMKQGDDALKRFVAQHYKGAGWKTDEVVEGVMDSRDFYANEIVQVKTPSLYRGRFVLVGDAGYAPSLTGGGTTLAIAGAYVLAGEVGKHKGNLAAGLRGYEEQMRPIIDDLQKIPPLVPTIFAPQTVWGIWLRNNIFAFIAWTRILEFVQKYFASSFASADRYGLPDYEWVA